MQFFAPVLVIFLPTKIQKNEGVLMFLENQELSTDLCESARAAVTAYHRLDGSYKPEFYFLQFWRPGSLRSRPHILVHRQLSFCCVLT